MQPFESQNRDQIWSRFQIQTASDADVDGCSASLLAFLQGRQIKPPFQHNPASRPTSSPLLCSVGQRAKDLELLASQQPQPLVTFRGILILCRARYRLLSLIWSCTRQLPSHIHHIGSEKIDRFFFVGIFQSRGQAESQSHHHLHLTT